MRERRDNLWEDRDRRIGEESWLTDCVINARGKQS